jgi:DNA-binding ferritin-like protein
VSRSPRDGLDPRQRKGNQQRDGFHFDEDSEWWLLKGQPAAYYRAAAARARSLEAEATTPRAKLHLRELIEQCERLAEEAEEATRNLR